ncbi:MAG: hypothetical protein ACLP9L_15815 [Thermoguttaceae bacterium]
MKLGILLSLGVATATALLLLLWFGIVLHFGTISHSLRYLRGYNYAVYPTRIDVGEGKKGEKRMAIATVRNLSFSPIRVIGVLRSCNCVVVNGLPLTIGPSQTENLQFAIYFTSSEGKVEHMATVLIDDGRMQRAPVTIECRCESPQ